MKFFLGGPPNRNLKKGLPYYTRVGILRRGVRRVLRHLRRATRQVVETEIRNMRPCIFHLIGVDTMVNGTPPHSVIGVVLL